MRRRDAGVSAAALLVVLLLGLPVGLRAQCDRIPLCELVWSDEFEGTSIDTDKWEFQRGDGTSVGLPAGWGNNELQYYQQENATVADGFLTITARRESVSGYQYTSARLRTLDRGDWTYGRMEMRARMPIGQGLWPAFWMLPSDTSIYGGWAASGEIDIMEYIGSEPSRVIGTIHYGSPWPGNVFSASEFLLSSGSFSDEFHDFAVEWEPGEIRWYVDGVLYGTKTEWYSSAAPYPAPFDVDFHLLLNMAVGGNLPGAPDSTTSFPQSMVVDYVRVYQSRAKKGTQVESTTLLYEKPVRMKKIDASLWTVFENQARRQDSVANARGISCRVSTRGRKGALTAKGRLRLTLIGRDGERRWTSGTAEAPLAGGEAGFSTLDVEPLINAASREGVTIERARIRYDGSGSKKVTRLDIDCWQRPD